MFGLGGPILILLGLLTAGTVTGWAWAWHMRGEQGEARAQIEQLAAVNEAALAAAGRLTAENQRMDAALAARRRTGDDIDRMAGDARRRLDDALQAAPEWADGPVPALVGGLLADGDGGPAGSAAGAAPDGAIGPPPRTRLPSGP